MTNPPTLRCSNAVHQTASNTKPGTMGTQQNTTAPRTFDEKVEQLLLKARSLTRADEARGVAEVLEKMLDPKLQITLSTRRRCFRGLVKLCGEYGVLPSPYIIPDSKVEKLGDEPISVGGFSQVWPGMYEDERAVAIKIIQYYEKDGVQTIKKSFCREVITWRRLSHPNILELIGVMMDDGGCAMVAPWMDNGNIVDYVREEPHVNPLRLLEEATRGLQYLHSVDLAHGDLKGGNILISEEGHACLADVGLTRVAGDLSSNTATTGTTSTEGANSTRWCPPEILDPERFGFKRGGPTKKSDVYSMAMTIYQVLTDRIPFYDCSDLYAMLRIVQGLRPKKPIFAITRGYTEELWDMTVSCWKENPIERPIVDKLLEALKVAGERWGPRRGWPSTLSPQDDRSPTLCAEESDSRTLFEPEDDDVTTESPTSCYSPHSFATKSPVFATTPFTLPPFLPVPPPPVAEDKASPATPDKENTDPPRNLSGGDSRSSGEGYKPTPIPGEEVTNDVSTTRTRKEDPEKPIQQIPTTPETEGVQRTPPALSEARFRVPPSACEVQGTTPIEPLANQTLSTEVPGPPALLELKPTPITAEASNSLISPQSSATQAPVPISLPINPVHPLPVSTPSTANSGTQPSSRLTSADSRKDLVNPVVPRRPGGEESTLVSFVVGEEETRSRSVRSTREEELEPISITLRKEETKTGADRLSIHEERRPTLAPSKREGIRQAPISPTPTTSRDTVNDVAPVNPTFFPKEIGLTSFRPNGVPPEPTLAPSQNQGVRPISPGSRKEVSNSSPTSFPTSGEVDDYHAHAKRSEDVRSRLTTTALEGEIQGCLPNPSPSCVQRGQRSSL